MAPLILIDVVGLTNRLLPYAIHLNELAKAGWCVSLKEAMPAVTCTAQAAVLTGQPARLHGIVGNGWLYHETGEIRFWQQSNRLIQSEPIYSTAKRNALALGRTFRCAKLFWWFNQGADVAISVTPKPYYGADGNKRFGIQGTPEGLTQQLERNLGPFPFHTFWGPMAGLPCTQWIANCAAEIIKGERPDLTLVYLPHLDYDPQRHGPDQCDMSRLVAELDAACIPLIEAAKVSGARVWIMSEYCHFPVHRPVYINRLLRQAGMLAVRSGPFGANLDTLSSRAFAVCDHQLAHIYVRDYRDVEHVRDLIGGLPGVAQVFDRRQQAEIELDHPRSGDLIALSSADSWFAYPFWLEDREAPDYARTVDIHRKPGYDPCELLFDPALWWPRGRAMLRLLQKKLGFRTLLDVVPLDAGLIRGSHGLRVSDPLDQPILIGDGPMPLEMAIPMKSVHGLLLRALEFGQD